MAVVNSPNMNLPVPVVGNEAGPQYAIDINACLAQIDAHDHTAGQGVQITPSAININADLPFNSNNATLLRSTRFLAQGSPISGTSDLNCLSVSGVDLYYRDGSGNIVRITQSGGVAGSPGSIANLTSPASASYVAINSTFVWQSDANIAATMDMRSAILRNAGASSFGLTIQPPTLSGDITQTLPQVPLAPAFMTMASTGVMGTTIPIAQGITTSMIADSAVTTAKIADTNVTLAKMAANSIDTSQLVDASVTQAKLAAVPQAASGNSGNFTTTSASPVLVTGQSVTLASTGRPVVVVLAGTNAGNSGFTIIDASNPPVGFISFYKDGSLMQENRIGATVIGASFYFPGNLTALDNTPSAGSHTYEVKAYVTSSPTTVLGVSNLRLLAYEL